MRKRMVYMGFVFAVGALAGCMSTGNKLDPGQVNRIQKGVTTRAQVDQMLGPPSMVSLLPDGRRQAMYVHTESRGDALLYTPYVNYFAGGTKNRKQMLQIIYRNDVVEDYEFSDTSVHSTGGLLNPQGVETKTPGTDSLGK